MSAAQAAQVFDHNRARMIGDGVFYPDIVMLEHRIRDWSEWFDAWARMAQEYEAEAAEAEKLDLLISAGEKLFQASICWHYAQFLWFHDHEQRRHGQQQKARTYHQAAPHLVPPAERVDVPFEGTRIPGYLRLPPEAKRPVSCVILLGGLESTKEESYQFENLLLQRGMGTFAFDGPGQGEYFFEQPFVPDWERWTSAVVDHLEGRSEIDRNRLGVLGRSLGGYLAVRSASREPRLRCCVAFGALFDLSFFDEMVEVTGRGFGHITGIPDEGQATKAIIDYVDLSDVITDLCVPLYVLHGAKDPLIPVEQAYRLEQAATNADVTMHVEADGDHCAHNLFHRVRPAMADWLTLQLRRDAPRP